MSVLNQHTWSFSHFSSGKDPLRSSIDSATKGHLWIFLDFSNLTIHDIYWSHFSFCLKFRQTKQIKPLEFFIPERTAGSGFTQGLKQISNSVYFFNKSSNRSLFRDEHAWCIGSKCIAWDEIFMIVWRILRIWYSKYEKSLLLRYSMIYLKEI